MSLSRHYAYCRGVASVDRKELTSHGSPIGVEDPYTSGFTALTVTSDVRSPTLRAFAVAHLDPRSGSGMTWFLKVEEDGVWCCHPQRTAAVILNAPLLSSSTTAVVLNVLPPSSSTYYRRHPQRTTAVTLNVLPPSPSTQHRRHPQLD